MSEAIHIDIAANGDVQIEGIDVIGPDCKALTKEIEQALGTVTKEVKKAAFHLPPKIVRKVGV